MNLKQYVTRRRFLAASAVTVAGLTGLYAWRVEPHWLQVVRRRMPVANLPDELVGATLAQVSDLHIGPQVDDAYVVGVMEDLRQLKPEFVVYTGDFTSYSTNLVGHAQQIFPSLALGTHGTFGVLGNHDYGPGWKNETNANQIVSLAENAGIRMLRNEMATAHGLTVIGMDELWAGRFDPNRVLLQVDADVASVVLVHNPDTVDRAGWAGYSGWILAGHTHGGQCKPPFLPPPLLPVQNRRYTSGEFALSGGRSLYISRGVGHLMRVRFNVRPEITLFELTRDDGRLSRT